MDGIGLIQDRAIVLLTAGVASIFCARLELSVIVGHLIAGRLIGPLMPPISFIHVIVRIQTLSQVGRVFLIAPSGEERLKTVNNVLVAATRSEIRAFRHGLGTAA
jgi:Kef-type K+ transport system membrane component KefB